jgi:hypothetical protein
MWMFHPVGKIDEWLGMKNHTIIVLIKMVVQYPATIAVFLGNMTFSKRKQILSIVLWSGIYAISELVAKFTGVMTYHNGWNFWWDCTFNVMMLFMLLIHYRKPILAWILTIPIVVGLFLIFHIPFSVLK